MTAVKNCVLRIKPMSVVANGLVLNKKFRKGLKKGLKVVGSLVLAGLVVRLTPYLCPIRAKALVQDDSPAETLRERAIIFTDRHGLPLGTILNSSQDHTMIVPLAQVSPFFLQAIVAAEDQRFYQHHGVDSLAALRALRSAVQARQVVSGASTITMQLARMISESHDRTLWSKGKEIWLAWRLEAGMSKSEILAAYVNRLPMGGNLYGVEAAARTFFGVPAADLTLEQASLLAALPNDPIDLNPYGNLSGLQQRQQYVLDRMVKAHDITLAQATRAEKTTPTLRLPEPDRLIAPHFLFWLARQLPAQAPAQVQTTIDRPLQEFVEAQVRQVIQSLGPYNVHQAAALVIDNATGEVLAYVGSPDYFTAQQGSNDGVQALRQPGSALKPFLYELALEQGIIAPNSILADVPTSYAIPGARLYSPSDYSDRFQGPVRLRLALANSLNVPAVRLLEKVTVPIFLTRLHQLGFQHLTQSPDYYGLGLALGSGEVSLWELARAYVTLARQGVPISFVTEFGISPSETLRERNSEFLFQRRYANGIRNSNEAALEGRGETLLSESPSRNISEPRTPNSDFRSRSVSEGETPNSELRIPNSEFPNPWLFITNVLADPYARAHSFGVDSVLALPFPAAVKTGTSSDFRDTWTVGYTRDYTVATWVGNFDGTPMQKVSGVTGAAPLWHRIMLKLHETHEPGAFPEPSWPKVPLCAQTGLPPTIDCEAVVLEYVNPDTNLHLSSNPTPKSHTSNTPDQRSALNHPNPEPRSRSVSRGETPSSEFRIPNSEFRILFPQQNDRFLFQPTGNGTNPAQNPQKIQFKIALSPGTTATWRLNGKTLAVQAQTALLWNVQPGEWTLEVQAGDRTDRVSFRVEAETVTERSLRRGFVLLDSR